MKDIEITFDEHESIGYESLSIVNEPAIGENFIALSEQKIKLAKMIEGRLVGAVLIPDLKIPRIDPRSGEVYNIFFSAETIRKIAYQSMRDGLLKNYNIQHEEKVNNICTVESWIVEDSEKDKSAVYGFDVPVGTYMVVAEVNDEETKKRIESGELKGFSIEYNPQKKEQVNLEAEATSLLKYLISAV